MALTVGTVSFSTEPNTALTISPVSAIDGKPESFQVGLKVENGLLCTEQYCNTHKIQIYSVLAFRRIVVCNPYSVQSMRTCRMGSPSIKSSIGYLDKVDCSRA